MPDEERAKVLRGTIGADVTVWLTPTKILKGSEGYLALIHEVRASVPDAHSSIVTTAVDTKDVGAHIIITHWFMHGTFSGPAPLWGAPPTHKPISLQGYTRWELKGAQVTKMDTSLDLGHLAQSYDVRASTLLPPSLAEPVSK